MDYAGLLLRTEDREQMDPKLRRKIENLVRKSAGVVRRSTGEQDDSPDRDVCGLTPCPFCQEDVREMDVSCVACKSEIPFFVLGVYDK